MKALSALLIVVVLVLILAFGLTFIGCLPLMMFDYEIKAVLRQLTLNLAEGKVVE